MKEEFTVCVLSRADLEALGYDPNSLSDSDMERVASKWEMRMLETGSGLI